MENFYTQIGVFGVFAILVIREVLKVAGEWKAKNGKTSRNGEQSFVCRMKEMDVWTRYVTEQLTYLRSWHEKEDSTTGLPRGYTPHGKLRDINHILQDVQRDIQDCKELLKKLST